MSYNKDMIDNAITKGGVNKCIGQSVAILTLLGLYYVIITKWVKDVSAILSLNPSNFWMEFAKYLIANIGGGGL